MLLKVKAARRYVAALRAALIEPSPSEIGRCLPSLVEAAQALGSIQRELAEETGEQPELRAELQVLRKELHLTRRLIENSAAFYRGWADLLGAAVAGYQASGQAGALTAPIAISVEG